MSAKQLDPNKTMLIVKHQGRKVGQVPATATRAEAYLADLTRQYGSIEIDYQEDDTLELLGGMFGPRRHFAG